MSRLEALDLGALRARLAFALGPNDLEGSLYLFTLCICFLTCDERSVGETTMLEAVYYSQAEAESVDGDDLLTAILMAVPS